MDPDQLGIHAVSNRRELLKALGAGAFVSSLAGCLGGDEETDTPTSGGNGNGGGTTTTGGNGNGDGTTTTGGNGNGDGTTAAPEVVDQRVTFYTGIMTSNPQAGQWNPLNPSGNLRPYYGHAKFAYYSPFTREFVTSLFSEVSKEGNRLSMHLRDGHTWAPSGDPVTATDLRTKFFLEDKVTGSPRQDVVESYEVVNDKQLDLVLQNPDLRRDLFFGSIMGDWLNMKHSVYREYVEGYEDATATSERTTIQENVVNFSWENENVELSGQFEPPELRENSILFTTRTDDGKLLSGGAGGFPNETLYGELELHVVPEGQTELQLIMQGDDVFTAFRGAEAELAPAKEDPNIRTRRVATNIAYVMVPNLSADFVQDPAVRKAMAYAIDWNRAREVAMPNSLATYPFHPGVSGAAGTGDLADPKFKGTYGYSFSDLIPNYSLDKFRMYGREPKTDAAATVLQDAGYARNSDDMWADQDGNVVSVNVLSSSIADFFQNQTLEWATSLRNFGFDSQAEVLPYDQFFSRAGAGDYDTTIIAWYGNPPFAFNQQNMTYIQAARRDAPPTGELTTDPITFEVPEFGNTEGDLQEVNVSELLNGARTATDDATYNENVSKLAWVSNEALPTIFAGDILDVNVYRTENLIWPDDNSKYHPIQWYTDAIDHGVPHPRM